ncbi:Serine/threonine-protein kinase PknB [Aquisphaera giovannonii]|uniref:Serine/threonine-protein kinase PknB n=1 Tax=Aquisphaera giovannonii TaxID=406548 RepID=A0A5B9W2Q7_9BACT|nr:protein kinase [Aquisphaera giovannonii]QEH34868.1 Serine/threonine-protein kinase PknB [Aquisphaera giovannonii]
MAGRSSISGTLDDLTDSRFRRVDQLCDGFEAAWRTGRPSPIESFLDHLAAGSAERAALLRELVALEAEFRRRLGDPPRAEDYRGRFPEFDASWLDGGAAGGMPAAGEPGPCEPAGAAEDRPRQVGKFRLVERVGTGAFGTVWKALDVPLGRVVALKIPHAHLVGGGEDMARFYREARTIAQLRHPGIVPVHEVMVLDGLPILVCDYVTGTSLRDLLARGRPSPRDAALLVARAAGTLAYAHAMGAIHRDIKPANIMTERSPARPDRPDAPRGASGDAPWAGEPRIVDFGLASLEDDAAQITHDGAVIGTPAYMSPEQAAGRVAGRPVDHRTDIYSMGVVLYELLTGTIPFTGGRAEVLARVIGEEPRPPRQLDRSVPRDLESICLKAMAKEPRHRYPTALAMADDLRHFLDGEPVSARPISTWRRILRRAHRRPAEAAMGLMVVVTALAVCGLVLGYLYHQRLEVEFRATDLARRGEAHQRRLAESFLYFQRMALAEREWTANNIDRVERLLEECPPNSRGWEWRYLKKQCRHERLTLRHARPSDKSWTVSAVRFLGDGRRIASASKDGFIRIWDAEDGRCLHRLGESTRAIYGLAVQPGTGLLAAGGEDGVVRIWDPDGGRLMRRIDTGPDTIYALAFSPDGRTLATGHGYPALEEVGHMRGKGVIRTWDAAAGRLERTLRGHTQNLMGLAYSPDGGRLASVSGSWLTVPQVASRPGELILWDAATGEEVRRVQGHEGPLTGLAYSPGGDLIATSSWDGTIRLWDALRGAPRRVFTGHQDWVLAVAFSPEGSHLASAGADGAIKVWDLAGGRGCNVLRGHTKNVTCVAYSPDGRRIASGSSDQTVKLWDADVRREARVWRGAGGPVARVAFFADGGRLLASANREDDAGLVTPRLMVLDATGAPRAVSSVDAPEGARGRPVDGIAVRPDGGLVAAAYLGGHLEARSAPDWRVVFRRDEPANRFQSIALGPDGRTLVVVGQLNAYLPDGTAAPNVSGDNALAIAFDLESGAELWRFAGAETGIIRDVAISPDGSTVATADNVGSVTLLDAATGRVRSVLRGHNRVASHVAFSPDGKRLASASWDSTVAVWDLASGRVDARLYGHMRSVLCVAFSPDGRRLATTSEDRTVRLWDVPSGQELIILRGHSDIVTSVAFSPDGNRLATAGADGTVQIREAAPGP